LTFNDSTVGNAGLFSVIGAGGGVRDLNLANFDMTENIAGSYAGILASWNEGTIANVSASGSVTNTVINSADQSYTGGLVGVNFAAITGSYANATVTGAGSSSVGGLVGFNAGTIAEAYATGQVSTTLGDSSIGGLVGLNDGTIEESYTAEAVYFSSADSTKSRSDEGGLVGYNAGLIYNDYSMGAVSNRVTPPYIRPNIGGLIGYDYYNNAGTMAGTIADSYSTTDVVDGTSIGSVPSQYITNTYWDTETSGVTLPFYGATGLTTGQLSGSLPAGFSSSVWGTGPNLLPYFLWQYPTGTPQVIAGAAYRTGGYTPLASSNTGTASVSALLNGNNLGSAITGANGYFYFLLPPGSISSSGEPVLVYTQASSAVDASNAATLETATGSLPFMQVWGSQFIAPTSATTYSTASAVPLQTQDATLITQAAGSDIAAQLLVDDLSNYGYIATGGSFTINEALDVTDGLFVQTTGTGASISVPDALTFTGTQKLKLTATGNVTLNDAISLTGLALISSGGTLSFGNAITATDGISLTSNSNLVIDSAITAKDGTLALSSDGTISESGAGSISAEVLTGGSSGGTTLTGIHNGLGAIESFTNRGAGGISIVCSGGLVLDSVSAGSGALSITTTDGAIEDNGTLEAGGAIFLKSSGLMDVGAISDGGAITLDAGGNIDLTSQITSGGVLTLVSGGSITSVSISAKTLTGSAASTTLDGHNDIANLANFNDGSGSFSLADTTNLKISGLLQAGAVTLSSTVGLSSIDAIVETTGAIDASTLTGAAIGKASFSGANHIATLEGGYYADGIALADGQALAIGGTLSSSVGNIALTTTGTGSNIAVDSSIDANGTLTFSSAGAITETDKSVITALEFTGNAAGNVSLTGPNQIAVLGNFKDTTGNFSLTDRRSLTISGTVNTGKYNQTLEVTAGDLDISGALTGNTVTLGSSTGGVYGGGTITASLLNVLADTGIDLTGPNKIKKIGTNETNAGPDIINNTE
jgi:hypothetical protein